MACKKCDDMLTAYKRSARLFVDAERNCQGLLGSDFQMALKEMQRLHKTSMDANAALTAHWRKDQPLAQGPTIWRMGLD